MERRYDIDWLRVIAIGLLLIYHTAIGFQPWGVFIKFIQSNQSINWLWKPMVLLNVWRIPILFFVSGMGVYFALRKRNLKELIIERTRRIFIPLLFGSVCIVPIHVFLWQNFYSQELNYSPGQGHLWFLANIFIYILILSPFFYFIKKKQNSRFINFFKKIYGNLAGLMVISLIFIIEALIVKPQIYSLYAFSLHGFILGFLSFLIGFTLAMTGNIFWETVLKWKWFFIPGAFTLYFIRISTFNLESPNYLMALESIFWIFIVFGLSYKFLNRSSRILNYLSKSAYPIYIVHMIFLFLSAYYLFPLNIPVIVKFILNVLLTFTGSFILYEFLIKRVRFLQPLFGLKNKK